MQMQHLYVTYVELLPLTHVRREHSCDRWLVTGVTHDGVLAAQFHDMNVHRPCATAAPITIFISLEDCFPDSRITTRRTCSVPFCARDEYAVRAHDSASLGVPDCTVCAPSRTHLCYTVAGLFDKCAN
jgi:hypothetical protein